MEVITNEVPPISRICDCVLFINRFNSELKYASRTFGKELNLEASSSENSKEIECKVALNKILLFLLNECLWIFSVNFSFTQNILIGQDKTEEARNTIYEEFRKSQEFTCDGYVTSLPFYSKLPQFSKAIWRTSTKGSPTVEFPISNFPVPGSLETIDNFSEPSSISPPLPPMAPAAPPPDDEMLDDVERAEASNYVPMEEENWPDNEKRSLNDPTSTDLFVLPSSHAVAAFSLLESILLTFQDAAFEVLRPLCLLENLLSVIEKGQTTVRIRIACLRVLNAFLNDFKTLASFSSSPPPTLSEEPDAKSTSSYQDFLQFVTKSKSLGRGNTASIVKDIFSKVADHELVRSLVSSIKLLDTKDEENFDDQMKLFGGILIPKIEALCGSLRARGALIPSPILDSCANTSNSDSSLYEFSRRSDSLDAEDELLDHTCVLDISLAPHLANLIHGFDLISSISYLLTSVKVLCDFEGLDDSAITISLLKMDLQLKARQIILLLAQNRKSFEDFLIANDFFQNLVVSESAALNDSMTVEEHVEESTILQTSLAGVASYILSSTEHKHQIPQWTKPASTKLRKLHFMHLKLQNQFASLLKQIKLGLEFGIKMLLLPETQDQDMYISSLKKLCEEILPITTSPVALHGMSLALRREKAVENYLSLMKSAVLYFTTLKKPTNGTENESFNKNFMSAILILKIIVPTVHSLLFSYSNIAGVFFGKRFASFFASMFPFFVEFCRCISAKEKEEVRDNDEDMNLEIFWNADKQWQNQMIAVSHLVCKLCPTVAWKFSLPNGLIDVPGSITAIKSASSPFPSNRTTKELWSVQKSLDSLRLADDQPGLRIVDESQSVTPTPVDAPVTQTCLPRLVFRNSKTQASRLGGLDGCPASFLLENDFGADVPKLCCDSFSKTYWPYTGVQTSNGCQSGSKPLPISLPRDGNTVLFLLRLLSSQILTTPNAETFWDLESLMKGSEGQSVRPAVCPKLEIPCLNSNPGTGWLLIDTSNRSILTALLARIASLLGPNLVAEATTDSSLHFGSVQKRWMKTALQMLPVAISLFEFLNLCFRSFATSDPPIAQLNDECLLQAFLLINTRIQRLINLCGSTGKSALCFLSRQAQNASCRMMNGWFTSCPESGGFLVQRICRYCLHIPAYMETGSRLLLACNSLALTSVLPTFGLSFRIANSSQRPPVVPPEEYAAQEQKLYDALTKSGGVTLTLSSRIRPPSEHSAAILRCRSLNQTTPFSSRSHTLPINIYKFLCIDVHLAPQPDGASGPEIGYHRLGKLSMHGEDTVLSFSVFTPPGSAVTSTATGSETEEWESYELVSHAIVSGEDAEFGETKASPLDTDSQTDQLINQNQSSSVLGHLLAQNRRLNSTSVEDFSSILSLTLRLSLSSSYDIHLLSRCLSQTLVSCNMPMQRIFVDCIRTDVDILTKVNLKSSSSSYPDKMESTGEKLSFDNEILIESFDRLFKTMCLFESLLFPEPSAFLAFGDTEYSSPRFFPYPAVDVIQLFLTSSSRLMSSVVSSFAHVFRDEHSEESNTLATQSQRFTIALLGAVYKTMEVTTEILIAYIIQLTDQQDNNSTVRKSVRFNQTLPDVVSLINSFLEPTTTFCNLLSEVLLVSGDQEHFTLRQHPSFTIIASQLLHTFYRLVSVATCHPYTCLLALFDIPEHAQHELRQAANAGSSASQINTSHLPAKEKSIPVIAQSTLRLHSTYSLLLKNLSNIVKGLRSLPLGEEIPDSCVQSALQNLSSCRRLLEVFDSIMTFCPKPLVAMLGIVCDDNTLAAASATVEQDDMYDVYGNLDISTLGVTEGGPNLDHTSSLLENQAGRSPQKTLLSQMLVQLEEFVNSHVLIERIESSTIEAKKKKLLFLRKEGENIISKINEIKKNILYFSHEAPPLLVEIEKFFPTPFELPERPWTQKINSADNFVASCGSLLKRPGDFSTIRCLDAGYVVTNNMLDGTEYQLVMRSFVDEPTSDDENNFDTSQKIWDIIGDMVRLPAMKSPQTFEPTRAQFHFNDPILVHQFMTSDLTEDGTIGGLLEEIRSSLQSVAEPESVSAPPAVTSSPGDATVSLSPNGMHSSASPSFQPSNSKPSNAYQQRMSSPGSRSDDRRRRGGGSRLPARHVDEFERQNSNQRPAAETSSHWRSLSGETRRRTSPKGSRQPPMSFGNEHFESFDQRKGGWPGQSSSSQPSWQGNGGMENRSGNGKEENLAPADEEGDLDQIPGWTQFVAEGNTVGLDIMKILLRPKMLHNPDTKAKFMRLLERHPDVKQVFISLGVEFE
eukprot:GHVP01014341.1.p1 GENE.GHVP01014341.1~~GHVP01014341.1.p1  ORF type:complete len:2550 (+),score=444.63 GHVP01014341.1:820-7650(+)